MELLSILQTFYPISSSEAKPILDLAEEIKVAKNQIIIEADKTSKYLYFIKEGICRIYYHKQEKEVVLEFCLPGEALISLNSYIHNTPGYEHIDTLENVVLYRIPTAALQHLFETSLPIANFGRKLAEIETLKIEDRLMQNLFQSASERYNNLLQKEPTIIQRVKLGFIASYLGVSQVTLSRIRADIR